MGREKLGVMGIQCRIQSSLDARNVDFSIFNVGMIAVQKNRGRGEEQQNGDFDETRACCPTRGFLQNL
jgi:hypothetical protein